MASCQIGIYDKVGMFASVILDPLKQCLPLHDIHWTFQSSSSTSAKPTSTSISNLTSTYDLLQPLTNKSYTFSNLNLTFRSLDTNNNFLNYEWHDIPTLEVYVVTCSSTDDYKKKFQSKVIEWAKDTSQQTPARELAILFIPTGNRTSSIKAIETLLKKVPHVASSSILKYSLNQTKSRNKENTINKNRIQCQNILNVFAQLTLKATTMRYYVLETQHARYLSSSLFDPYDLRGR